MARKPRYNRPKVEQEVVESVVATEEEIAEAQEEPVEVEFVQESTKPKLYGLATCQIVDASGKVLLEQGELALIIGETDDEWKIENGFVSKHFILKRYK